MYSPERHYHNDYELPLEGEKFVYGSNLQGINGAGAALVAKRLGARSGVAEGPNGPTYAIPTRSCEDGRFNTLNLIDVAISIENFCQYTLSAEEFFFVTSVGCGHAGFKEELIVPLFRSAVNCSFPAHWEPFFEVADILHDITITVINTRYAPELTIPTGATSTIPKEELWAGLIKKMYFDQECSGPSEINWVLWSFKLSVFMDSKPDLNFPVGPYWVVKTDKWDKHIHAYLPDAARVRDYWSQATPGSIAMLPNPTVPANSICFTKQYPKPSWWPF